MFRRSEKGFSVDCIYNDKPTTEENGATFEVKLLNKYNEVYVWSLAMKEQLAYFQNVFIINEYQNVAPDFKIYETEDFKYSELTTDKYLHLCLNDVYYPLDFKYLGIDPIRLPIALKFSLEDGIIPLPARETFYNTEESKKLILDKIEKVANWFVSKYNETERKEFPSFLEANKRLSFSGKRYVSIINTDFVITDIEPYSKIQINSVRATGYNTKHLKLLHSNFYTLTREIFPGICKIKYNGTLSKNYHFWNANSTDICVLIDQVPTGKLREYFKESFKTGTKFFKYKPEIPLFREKGKEVNISRRSWYSILNLKEIPRKEWAQLIEQAKKVSAEVFATFQDYRGFKVPESWKTAKRSSSIYKTLDKKKGDITVSYARGAYLGNSIVFEKMACALNTVHRNKFLTIYGTLEDKEKLLFINALCKCMKKRYKVAIIGPNDSKKIKNIHNFKTINQFMELPVVSKFISAHEIVKVIETLKNVNTYSSIIPVFEQIYKKHEDLLKFALDYYDKYNDYSLDVDNPLFIELRDFIVNNNLLDKNYLAKTEKFKELIKPLSFLKHLKKPGDVIDKDFISLVYKMILFEKIYHNKFEDCTIEINYAL